MAGITSIHQQKSAREKNKNSKGNCYLQVWERDYRKVG